MGSGSHRIRGNSVAHGSIWQASLWLLHGAQAAHHGRCHLLGMEGLSGGVAGLDVGVHRRWAAAESLSAYSNATKPMATLRLLSRCSLVWMVCVLAYARWQKYFRHVRDALHRRPVVKVPLLSLRLTCALSIHGRALRVTNSRSRSLCANGG